MTKLKNFILGIKRPKRFLNLSIVAVILTAIFVGIHYFDICSERWILITASVFLLASAYLLFFYLFVSWEQCADLLQKAYHDLRQYEIVFEDMRHNVESAKECQKFKDDPQPSVLTFTEWVISELKHIEEMTVLMKEAIDIIKNTNNHITYD